MLGICYGMQLACQALGGQRRRATRSASSAGRIADHARNESDDLFAGVPRETDVWMSHGDQVDSVSDDFVPLASTDTCPHRRREASHAARSTACSFIPRSPTRRDGSTILAQLPDERLRLPRHLAAGRLRRADDRARSASASATTA